jgi:TPR repeat protein
MSLHLTQLLVLPFLLWASAVAAQGVDPALLQKAKTGDAQAQFQVGQIYARGITVPQDLTLAAEWYRKSADSGSAKAQYALGLLYSRGEGVPQDSAQAAAWYRKAALQGDADAQYNLGTFFE